jgi:hypothetical protein
LDWLNRERARLNANWGMINTLSTPQFQAATSTCARLRPVRVEGTLDITRGQLYGRNGRSFADLTDGLNPTVIGNSLAWQGVMLSGLGLSPDRPDRVAFAFRTGKAVTFPEGTQLYNGGVVSLACDTPGFRLSQIEVRVTDAIRPFGWFYPTDLSAPPKGVQLGVVLEQPWYWRLLPSTIHVQAQAWCYAGG